MAEVGEGLMSRARSMSLTRATRSLILFLPLLACSCTDTAAVQQFAESSKRAGAEFEPLASEGLESCKRATSYVMAGQIAPDCSFYQRIEPPLILVNNNLFSYVSSLGGLAGLSVSHTGSTLASLGADLKLADPTLSDINLSRANASASLAGTLAGALASGYRQRKLIAIIEQSNSSVQQVVGFLDEYAAYRYAQQFRDEQSRERAFCVQWTDPAVAEVAREPVAVDLLKRKCVADFNEQAERLLAVQKYQQALRSIASLHQKLYDHRNQWKTVQLADDLNAFNQQLSEADLTMKKAFGVGRR